MDSSPFRYDGDDDHMDIDIENAIEFVAIDRLAASCVSPQTRRILLRWHVAHDLAKANHALDVEGIDLPGFHVILGVLWKFDGTFVPQLSDLKDDVAVGRVIWKRREGLLSFPFPAPLCTRNHT